MVYPNYYTEVDIPNDLFHNFVNKEHIYRLTNWVENSTNVATKILTKDNKNFSLLVEVFGNRGCTLSLSDTNDFWQTSELQFNVTVLRCASKECLKCKGPNESDCLQWSQGYVLDNSGTWLEEFNYLSVTNSTFFSIWGIFSMITIIVHIVLAFRYGRVMLEPVVYIQTIMMLVLSSKVVDKNWIEYLSFVQYFKFDFGFINLKHFSKLDYWTKSNTQLFYLKLFCEETLFNYLNLLILIFTIIIIKKFANYLKWVTKIIYLQIDPISNATLFWIFWFTINPFLMINTYYDFISFKNHYFCSIILSLWILGTLMYLFKTRFYCFKSNFVQNLYPWANIYSIYLRMVYRVVNLMLFLSPSQIISSIFIVIVLILQTSFWLENISSKNKLSLFENFDRASFIFCQGIMEIVVMIISIEKVSSLIIRFISTNFYSSIRYRSQKPIKEVQTHMKYHQLLYQFFCLL